MARLAIQGNPARNDEILGIFEMLGAHNAYQFDATLSNYIYYINDDYIVKSTHIRNAVCFFTLEQFLQNFPFRMGDKVIPNSQPFATGTITGMDWCPSSDTVRYTVDISGIVYKDYPVEYLKPYTATEPPQPAIDHARREHALVKEALIARFMQMPKEDLAAALADITVSNALFKSAMNSLNTQDLCTLDAKVYINEQKIDTTFLNEGVNR